MRKVLAVAVVVTALIAATGVAVKMIFGEPRWGYRVTDQPLQILVSGEVPDQRYPGVVFHQDSGDPTNRADAHWIMPEAQDQSLVSAQVRRLTGGLNAGEVVMFVGDREPEMLWSLFGVEMGSHLSQLDGDSRQLGFYLWQDEMGRVQVGIVYGPAGLREEQVYTALLVQTLQHLGKINRNSLTEGLHAPAKVQQQSWREVVQIERDFVSARGNSYVEWVRYLGITPNVDSDTTHDYMLVAVDGYLIPRPDTWWKSQSLTVSGTGSDWQLIKYGPHATVKTEAVSYTLLLGLGSPVSAKYSSEWSAEGLDIIDNSDPSNDRVHLMFQYNGGTYAEKPSVQYPAWVTRYRQGQPKIEWCHERRIEFSHPIVEDETLEVSVCDVVNTQ